MNLKDILSRNSKFSISKVLRSAAQTWRKGLLLVISIFVILSLTGCAGYIETHVTFYPNEQWTAETCLSFTPQQLVLLGGEQVLDAELQKEATTKLESRNIRYTWRKESQRDGGVNYIISTEGKGLEEFSQAVFSKTYVAELLGGPVSLHLTGGVSEGQTLVVGLDSNPSTGYSWEIAEMDREILQQVGKVEFKQESKLLGAPGKQILRFESLGTGQTNLKLIYRRPWEKDMEPTRKIYIQAAGIGLAELLTHLNNLIANPTATLARECECQKAIAIPLVGGDPMASPNLDLPEAFNWCDYGGCTPIKDQGACGSCWAFGTVAPLESNIKIKNGIEEDLSEQYLVSCNTDDWGCCGGWWAHDYHWWKMPPSESEAGAVLEEEFPYEGEGIPCSGPYSHPYKLNSWGCIGDANPPDCWTGDILPTEDLKQAIYTYGPVSVAVCAGPAFQNYEGGVFETDETCEDGVNHAVVLVGWDDNQGTNGIWILRNSWGPSWGEGGYMRIGYGISNVGSCANYIVYTLGPPADITVTPYQFNVALPPGDSTNRTLTIGNGGEGDLNFSIMKEYVVGMGLTSSGGPDGYGYQWIDSDEPGGPAYEWVEISGIGTPLSLGDDDYQEVSLPFAFNFYGHDKTTVKICSNGYLTFAEEGTAYANAPIPTVTNPNDFIAPFWDDLNPASSSQGAIYYYYDAENHHFIVEYKDVEHYPSGNPETFEVILHADGSIVYQYQTVSSGTGCTAGIENLFGSDGLEVVYNSSYLYDGLAVRIWGPTDWLSFTPNLGMVPPFGSIDITVTFNASELDTGIYEANMIIANNDPDENPKIVPVTLHVGVASVSIDPDSQMVPPGGSSSVDVVVDSATYNLMSCHVEVSYDSTIFMDVTVEEKGLLGTLILEEPGSGVIDGLVKYGVTRQAGNDPVPVSGPFITISFTVSDTAPVDTYHLDVHDSLLLDENLDPIPGVVENDGQVGGRKGDFDGDGDIDFYDFAAFGLCYGATSCDDPRYNSIGDFDDDCDIDFYDFAAFGLVYGT